MTDRTGIASQGGITDDCGIADCLGIGGGCIDGLCDITDDMEWRCIGYVSHWGREHMRECGRQLIGDLITLNDLPCGIWRIRIGHRGTRGYRCRWIAKYI
jgi:hypothetical protein